MQTGQVLTRDVLNNSVFLQRERLRQEAEELYLNFQYQDAKQRSLQLLEVAQHPPDTYFQAQALMIAGTSQESLGEYRESLYSFEQMLALLQDPQHEKSQQGWAYNGIGLAHKGLGQFTKAIENFKKYLDIATHLNDKSGQGLAYGNLGACYEKMGQYKSAIECHEHDHRIAVQLDDIPGQGAACCNLGNVHFDLGDFGAAI